VQSGRQEEYAGKIREAFGRDESELGSEMDQIGDDSVLEEVTAPATLEGKWREALGLLLTSKDYGHPIGASTSVT